MSEASGSHKAGPGRPAGNESDAVRERLLEAARELFLRYEFKAVSIKRIAEAAAVNGAMVNYYFGSKKGIYLAMVEDILTAMQEAMGKLNANSQQSVTGFIESYSIMLARNPWWPNFIVREVLFGEGEMRELILKKLGDTIAPALLRSIEKEVAEGNFRQDLDPRFALMSLLSLSIFPFLARPIMEQVLQIKLDTSHMADLRAHTKNLYLNGVRTQDRGNKHE